MTIPDRKPSSGAAAEAVQASGDPDLNEERVAAFLVDHPDFLVRRKDLLSDLELSVDAGDSVSLLERQVIALRDQNRRLREQWNTLIENATENDRVFSRTTLFTLALMDAPDLAGLDDVLAHYLVDGFDVDHATCFIEGGTTCGSLRHLAGIGVEEPPPLPRLFAHPHPVCAAYRPEEYGTVFPDASLNAIASIALVPLRAEGLNATLAIGSWDPQRFSPRMGKVFLLYIGDVLSRTLLRLGVRETLGME